jgi:type 1 fimbriae regulatory protein FimB/type 1 fimbriae regulatory protein FimE
MLQITPQLPFSAKFFSPPPKKPSTREREYLRTSERKAPFSTRSIRHIIARAGELADIPFQVHPHQLRHACGYYLAAQGHDTRAIQDYLGHKNIHHTVRYTQMSPQRFETFWID